MTRSLADVLAFLQQSAVTSTCDSLAAPFLTDTGYTPQCCVSTTSAPHKNKHSKHKGQIER